MSSLGYPTRPAAPQGQAQGARGPRRAHSRRTQDTLRRSRHTHGGWDCDPVVIPCQITELSPCDPSPPRMTKTYLASEAIGRSPRRPSRTATTWPSPQRKKPTPHGPYTANHDCNSVVIPAATTVAPLAPAMGGGDTTKPNSPLTPEYDEHVFDVERAEDLPGVLLARGHGHPHGGDACCSTCCCPQSPCAFAMAVVWHTREPPTTRPSAGTPPQGRKEPHVSSVP